MVRAALLRLRQANRRRTVDVFFVGYPKTGNTWWRYMLGCYAQEAYGLAEPPLFDEFDRLGRARRAGDLPGITFTHEPLETVGQTARDLTPANVVDPFDGKRVVLLVRHPLDALVSSWHQARLRNEPPYEGDLRSFLEHPVHGLEKLVRFYGLWEGAHAAELPVALVRYEDAREDTAAELERVLGFLGVDSPRADAVAAAVERASFANMQALEHSGREPHYASSGLGMFATGERSNADAFHVRRGKVGGYRDELPADLVPEYERRVAEAMGSWYGYGAPVAAGSSA